MKYNCSEFYEDLFNIFRQEKEKKVCCPSVAWLYSLYTVEECFFADSTVADFLTENMILNLRLGIVIFLKHGFAITMDSDIILNPQWWQICVIYLNKLL
jgi:hypothetical protein